MPKQRIDDTDVRLVPELCAAAIREKLADEFCCWLVLRHLDIVENGGTGRIGLRAAIRYLHDMFHLSERRIRQIIESGYRTFWRRGKGGWIYLVGIVPMCRLLSAGDLWSCYVMVPYTQFSVGDGYAKSILFAAVACLRSTPTPIVRMAEICDVSERTIQRRLRECEGLLFIRRNVLVMDGPDEDSSAPVWRLVDNRGEPQFVRDIPNSYEMSTGRQTYKRLRQRMRRSAGIQATHRTRSEDVPRKRVGIVHLFTAKGNPFADGEPVGSWRRTAMEA